MLGLKAGVPKQDMVRVFSTIFDTISAIMLYPPQCIAFLQDDHVRRLVTAQVKMLQEGDSAGTASLPYYAAILASICQVELQLGKNALYRQLLKTHVFEQSFETMSMTSEVCFDMLVRPCFAMVNVALEVRLDILIPFTDTWCSRMRSRHFGVCLYVL